MDEQRSKSGQMVAMMDDDTMKEETRMRKENVGNGAMQYTSFASTTDIVGVRYCQHLSRQWSLSNAEPI